MLNIGTLVLTQWNHHWLHYIRHTGLFCLMSKLCFSTHIVENTNTYLHPCTTFIYPKEGSSTSVRHILVECNHFARERKDIFGRRDVVESFRCHPTLIVLFLKQIKFYYKFKIILTVMFYLLHSCLHCVL